MSDIDATDAPDDDVAAIIIRAAQLGFAPIRVATALGVSPAGVAAIQQRIGASTRARVDQDQGSPRAPSGKQHVS